MSARLADAESLAWERHYPNGLGPGAFASPAWQRLMAAEAGPEWRLRRLCVDGARPFELPVLVRRGRSGRLVLETRPTAYPVAPIGSRDLGEDEWQALLRGLGSPWLAQLSLWLPPDTGLRPEPVYQGIGRVRVTEEDTYLIRLSGGVDAHLAERASSLRRRKLRANERSGLELVARPDRALRDAYFALYERVFDARAWRGERLSRDFFEGVATQLGDGGELCVALCGSAVVGGGVLLYDTTTVWYFQGSIDREAGEVSPHDALYLRALREAERRGLHCVNLGGVNRGNEGLVRFKQSWGAEAVPFTKLHFTSGLRVLLERLTGAS